MGICLDVVSSMKSKKWRCSNSNTLIQSMRLFELVRHEADSKQQLHLPSIGPALP